MHWASKYLSIPYKNMNCSKFVEHVLRDHFKRDYTFPQSEGSLFNQSIQIKENLPKFCYKTNDPAEGDLVLMHGARRMCHVGVYLKIKDIEYVLHSESSMKCSALHKFKDLKFFGYSVEGVYTWQR